MNFIRTKNAAFMMILFLLINDFAYATTGSNSGKGGLKSMLETRYFTEGLTWVLIAWAVVKWFDYFNNFNFQNAVVGSIRPAALTFLAFNWLEFANWVGLV
jgi:hypothetical protein